MWAVFRKDLRIFLRDRSALLFSLVMPILVITIIAEGLFYDDKEDSRRMTVPVVNEDAGPVATTFVKLLRERADVPEVSRAEAEAMVRDRHEAAAAIVFPPKLSKQYFQAARRRSSS
jgi:ABC-type Na+ efflux pump permease subunit